MITCKHCETVITKHEVTPDGLCKICHNPCTFNHKGFWFLIEGNLFLKGKESYGDMAAIISKDEYYKALSDYQDK